MDKQGSVALISEYHTCVQQAAHAIIIEAAEVWRAHKVCHFVSVLCSNETSLPLHFLETMEKKQANSILWSPNGQFCVLAGLRK